MPNLFSTPDTNDLDEVEEFVSHQHNNLVMVKQVNSVRRERSSPKQERGIWDSVSGRLKLQLHQIYKLLFLTFVFFFGSIIEKVIFKISRLLTNRVFNKKRIEIEMILSFLWFQIGNQRKMFLQKPSVCMQKTVLYARDIFVCKIHVFLNRGEKSIAARP